MVGYKLYSNGRLIFDTKSDGVVKLQKSEIFETIGIKFETN